MEKRKEEYQFDLVTSVMKLEEAIINNTYKDELTGAYLVMPVENMESILKAIRISLRGALDVEMNRKGKRFRPLRELMIKYFNDMNYGTRSIDESSPEDNVRKVALGEKEERDPGGET
jgi:hypothetical protein